MPENWLDLARDARKAASRLLAEENYRSSMSRAYYAAYSKVTHELIGSAALQPAPGREGPKHGGRAGIRPLIETRMPNMQQTRRYRLSELIGRLYTLRLDADYKPSVKVESRDAREAISIMNTIFDSF